VVLGAYPEHGFLGEEGDDVEGSGGLRWIVDPLDGTTNYVHGLPQYAVSVCLEQKGELLAGTVYDPVSDDCFTASLGGGAWLNGGRLEVSRIDALADALVAVSFPAKVDRRAPEVAAFLDTLENTQAFRRMGSAALNLAYVAAGRFDLCWATETKPWDVAAGFLLVREAGGIVTDLTGGPVNLLRPRFVAASTPRLHEQALTMLAAIR
jgi:myo-inositol-1(or 4)-monophosphatase